MTEFEQFVADHGEGLIRTAYLIVWNRDDAEELAQEALAKLARRWPKVKRMESPAAYARRVLINLVFDDSRDRARRRSELRAKAEHEPFALDPDPAQNADLYDALAALPARQRAVLVLRFFCDLTEAQTALALGCPQGTVKSTTARALAEVRAFLSRDLSEQRS